LSRCEQQAISQGITPICAAGSFAELIKRLPTCASASGALVP
jgi:hypothetical protein